MSESSPGVEDSGVSGTSQGALAVSGEGVGDDALLRGGAACIKQRMRSAPKSSLSP